MPPPSSATGVDFDVFVSYAHADADAVRPIADALMAAGLRVWFDAVIDNEFASITRAIDSGLARSKALVAYYSRTYVTRRACQWELTTAFLAAQQAGDPRDRLFVINPEDDAEHLQPVELRDAIYRSAKTIADENGRRELATAVSTRVQGLATSLGQLRTLMPPRWYGAVGRGSPRFVGRLTEMWALHSGLHAQFAAITTQRHGVGLAQVRGLGGMGKSLLAEEYALRFGAAFPGGIFWLRAFGNDHAADGPRDPASREAHRDSQMRSFLEELGQPARGGTTAQVQGLLARAIEANGQACLWVVDDLPSGLYRAEQDIWLAPHPLARTLVTTRSQEYELGDAIDLSLLSEHDAFELLTARRMPGDAAERTAARQLVADLGYHALATDVAGGALQGLKGLHTFQSFRETLARPNADALRLAAKLGPQLPNGHEKNIADTLLRSISQLEDDAYDFLRIAALLGTAPIPPALIALVFADVHADSQDAALARAAVASDRAAQLSLAQRAEQDEGGLTVHLLVSSTIREQPDPEGRIPRLRLAAIRALTVLFRQPPGSAQTGSASETLLSLVPHVTAISRDADTTDVDPNALALLLNAAGIVTSDTGRLAASEQLTRFALTIADPHLREPARAVFRHHLGTVLFRRGQVAAAIDVYSEALALAAGDDEVLAVILTDQSIALRAARRLDEAVAAARRALEIHERLPGVRHWTIANDLNNLGMVLRTAGALHEARQCYERALAMLGNDDDGPLRAKVLTSLARLLFDLGDLDAADRTYHQSLVLHERFYGPYAAEEAATLTGLGMVARRRGNLQQAAAFLQRSLDGLERAPERDPHVEAAAYSEMGQVHRQQAQWRDALQWFERALALDTDVYGPESLEVAEGLNNIGVTLQGAEDDAEARRSFEHAVHIRRRIDIGRNVDFVNVLINLSTSLWRLEEPIAALDALQEAERTLQTLPDAPPAVVGRLAANLTPVLRGLGRTTEARVTAERAVAVHRASGADGATIANDLVSLGRVLLDQGQTADGLASINQALQTLEATAGSNHPQTEAVRALLAALSETGQE